MTNDQPKISFIPKTSLVREETFLERPRPRSFLSFLAVVSLITSTGAYGVLYAFNYSLEQQISENVSSIQDSQKRFAENPVIDKAKNFQTRAERAQELLNSHVVTSPVFRFLKENTLASIYYNSFSYHESESDFQVSLTGEARSYTSLAFQSDILHLKTGELVKFAIGDVGLTKYGTVSFSLKLQFVPEYLSYSRDRAQRNSAVDISETSPATPTTVATTTTATTTSPVTSASTQIVPTFTSTTTPEAAVDSQVSSFTVTTDASAPAGTMSENVPVASQSSLAKFWSLFKFW